MKYAHIDSDGILLGYYDDEIHETMPEGCITLTDEQYTAACDNNHNKFAADGSSELVDLRSAEEIAEYEAQEYARNRRIEYPDFRDQLDDLFHAGAFSDEMIAKIQAVKDKYPKPE